MPSVAIVIPCFSHANRLAQAIDSATAQSMPAGEIIVVDDGSPEDLETIVSRYPGVTLIRQANAGLAAARNAGLRAASSDKVIFLDADDFLHPNAVAAGLRCFVDNRDSAFVYGAHAEQTGAATRVRYMPATRREDLVRFNVVGMVAAAMFDREKLLAENGFEVTLGMAEDWDIYLRLSRRHPFGTHPEVVATYVKHGGNMSADLARLRGWVDHVREREKRRGLSDTEELAWREGRDAWAYLDQGTDRRSLTRRLRRRVRGLVRGRRSVRRQPR